MSAKNWTPGTTIISYVFMYKEIEIKIKTREDVSTVSRASNETIGGAEISNMVIFSFQV